MNKWNPSPKCYWVVSLEGSTGILYVITYPVKFWSLDQFLVLDFGTSKFELEFLYIGGFFYINVKNNFFIVVYLFLSNKI